MSGNSQRPARRAHRVSTVAVRPADLVPEPAAADMEGERAFYDNVYSSRFLQEEIRLTGIGCSQPAGEMPCYPGYAAVPRPSPFSGSAARPVSKCMETVYETNGFSSSSPSGTLDARVSASTKEAANRGCAGVREYIRHFESQSQGGAVVPDLPGLNSIKERSASFGELLEAFRMLEKRPSEDMASRVLKKFRTNEECPEEGAVRSVPDIGLFPKIQNNPFIRRDIEAGIRPLREERTVPGSPQRAQRRQKRSSLRTSTSHCEK